MTNSKKNYVAHIAIALSLSSTVAFAAPFSPVNSGNSDIPKTNQEVYKVGNPYEVNGVKYKPQEVSNYDVIGIASWYGEDFNGKKTSNGEVYNMEELTAAHATLPMPSFVEVTNLENGKKVIVRVNDRGPFTGGRSIDVSKRAAELLGFADQGTAKVRVTLLTDISKQALADKQKINEVNNSAIDKNEKINESANQAIAEATPLSKEEIISDTEGQHMKNVNLVEPDSVKSYVPRGVFVQLGAFSDDNDNVVKEANSLSDVGVVSLQKVDVDGKNILRLRVGPYGSIDDAIKVKNRLVKLGYSSSRVVVEE
ncbi:Endolytic peptidoglycan transglycosylase RlpA [Candidatus Hepatincola sp. Pdp]